MGVVMRQSMKYLIVSYVFMGVSVAASLLLYPLDTDLYGTLTFFLDTVLLISPIIVFGMGSVSIRYFPEEVANGHGGKRLISSAMIVILTATGLLALLGYLFYGDLTNHFADKSDSFELEKALWLIIPLISTMAIQNFLILHISNYRLIAIPNFIQSLIRISLPIIFLCILCNLMPSIVGLYLMLLHFILAVVYLLWYLSKRERLEFDFSRRTIEFIMQKDIRTFATFATLTTIGSGLVFKIDSLMIISFLDAANTGVYAIGNKIGGIIAVPAAAVLGIVAPIVSSAMKEKKLNEVSDLYIRSSEVLTICGVFLLSGLAVIAKDLFSLMHDSDRLISSGIFTIVALIAFSRFIDISTSINSHIIALSDFFRYNLYFLLVLAVANITLNLVLIPRLGIVGAAMATSISLFLFNMTKIVFIKYKFGIWPFTYKTVVIVIIGFSAVISVEAIMSLISLPTISRIVVKGAFVSLVILGVLYFSQVSSDFNHLIKVLSQKILTLFKKVT